MICHVTIYFWHFATKHRNWEIAKQPIEQRICNLCEVNEIEDELTFFLNAHYIMIVGKYG